MDFLFVWSPLFSALGAVVLALLLVAGRADLRRAALLVAGGALLALLVAIVTIFTTLLVALGTDGPAHNGVQLIGSGAAVFQVADDVTTLLTFGAWSLLLYAAIRAGSRWRFVVLTLLFAVASALAIAVMTPQMPLMDGLRDWVFAASAPDGHCGRRCSSPPGISPPWPRWSARSSSQSTHQGALGSVPSGDAPPDCSGPSVPRSSAGCTCELPTSGRSGPSQSRLGW